jgi:hypothetical protein
MAKLITICAVIALLTTAGANAAVTLKFTEVDLGSNTQVNLTDQFAAYGVIFDDAYRYIDSRDPWQEPGPQGTNGYGASNGLLQDNGQPGEMATIEFICPTDYVTIDWWTIVGDITVDVYDQGGTLLDSFTGNGSGTETLQGMGAISTLTWHDSGGFVQIANMTYNPIPAPAAILLGGIGVSIVGWLRSRKRL